MVPLYDAIVAEARRPGWYLDGVPDTTDGRFDMVASVLSVVLLRLEREGAATRAAQALVTEAFIEDMDGALRQMGIGDLMVGKHVGKMMGTLSGRIGAYKEALAADAPRGGGDLGGAIARNILRDEAADGDAVARIEMRFREMAARVDALDLADVLSGKLA